MSTAHQRPRGAVSGCDQRRDAGRPASQRRRGDRRASRRRRTRRIAAGVAFAVAVVLTGVGLAVPGLISKLTGLKTPLIFDASRVRPTAAVSRGPVGSTPSAIAVTMSPTPPAPLLRMPGPVPSAGPGTFRYASGHGEVLGSSGTLRRYRVAVETGAGVDAQEFAETVDLVLGDPRSWIGSGRLRLQRVPVRGAHDFTIHLATARTAGRMCAAGGVDIRVDGRPYTSCRSGAKVVINLDRWLLSVDGYVAARVPLDRYREYVINHEVGHALGHSHERCPGKRRPAPTMMKQTLYLDGCVANPWPYLDGERYAGPPL